MRGTRAGRASSPSAPVQSATGIQHLALTRRWVLQEHESSLIVTGSLLKKPGGLRRSHGARTPTSGCVGWGVGVGGAAAVPCVLWCWSQASSVATRPSRLSIPAFACTTMASVARLFFLGALAAVAQSSCKSDGCGDLATVSYDRQSVGIIIL